MLTTRMKKLCDLAIDFGIEHPEFIAALERNQEVFDYVEQRQLEDARVIKILKL